MLILNKRKQVIFISITIFVILVLSICAYILIPQGQPVEPSAEEFDKLMDILMDGDIICRLGDRSWSLYFSNVSIEDKRFSHMGIIHIINGQITIINSEGDTGHVRDFVNEVTLEEFIKYARLIGIYRIMDFHGSNISNLAMDYIGVPFDWQFDMQDESKLYCTELLYVILKRIAPELQLKTVYSSILSRDIIPLEAISNSENFSEVFFLNR